MFGTLVLSHPSFPLLPKPAKQLILTLKKDILCFALALYIHCLYCRLELELGIKKQHDSAGVLNDYSDNFNANVCYPSPPQQQQQMLYRQQPTVLQVCG